MTKDYQTINAGRSVARQGPSLQMHLALTSKLRPPIASCLGGINVGWAIWMKHYDGILLPLFTETKGRV
jgi:hypothetical protein